MGIGKQNQGSDATLRDIRIPMSPLLGYTAGRKPSESSTFRQRRKAKPNRHENSTNARSGSSSGSIPNSNPPPPAATTGAAAPSSPRHTGEDTSASVSEELAGTTTRLEPLPSLKKQE